MTQWILCRFCKAVNPILAEFCHNCGKPLNDKTPLTSSPT